MQATLIYNENAGSSGSSSLTEIQEALRQVGFDPIYRATSDEDDLDPILEEPKGIVVAAGGDGTARAVATRLLGKETPLVILPLGTANNIFATLGVPLNPLEIIAGLKNAQPYAFDVGRVRAPWGEDYFLEGAGFGFFADTLARYDPEKGKSMLRSVQALMDIMRKGFAYENCLHLRGEEDRDEFLLVEALNTTAVGPRLKFAPSASPGDGLLDVVCIRASDREGFLHYLAGLVREDLDSLETVTVRQVQEVTLTWKGFPFHVDAEIRPSYLRQQQQSAGAAAFEPQSGWPQAEAGQVTIDLLPGAITLWLPAVETGPIEEI